MPFPTLRFGHLFRQSIENSGNVDFSTSVIEKLKVLTMAVVYGNNTKLLLDMSLAQLHDLRSI